MFKTIIIKNDITNTLAELNNNIKDLEQDGNIFCIVKSEYINGNISKDFMDVIEFGISKELSYINTIVIPSTDNMIDNILYCVWFVKNRNTFSFNKDAIREKSIWKDVEWGKREKNYNSKGKDPGNVWIPTEDDGKANITKHILLNINEVFNRLLSSTISNNDKYLIIMDDVKLKDYVYQDFKGKIIFKEAKYEDINITFNKKENLSNNYIDGKVFFGTSENMDYINNESVDLIVTSPPYWDLKNYYKENQIGQESYEIYSKRMFTVWKECYDKLKDDGSIWININIRIRNGNPILLPKLFVNQCKKIGFKYKGILVWHKSSGIPTNAKNLSDHHEYVLIFTKKNVSKINLDKLNIYHDYKNNEISGKMIWNINRKAGSVGKNTIHPAIFPTELINRIINIATAKEDIVLDPFLGSGTSMISALNNNRKFLGYEYNEGFKDLMDERFRTEIKEYKTYMVSYYFK